MTTVDVKGIMTLCVDPAWRFVPYRYGWVRRHLSLSVLATRSLVRRLRRWLSTNLCRHAAAVGRPVCRPWWNVGPAHRKGFCQVSSTHCIRVMCRSPSATVSV